MTDDDDGSDPFACFGDDDDDDEDGIVGDNDDDDGCNNGEIKNNNIVTNSALDSTSDNDLTTTMTTTTTQKRDPNCGSLAFHAGTEQALLMHVEREILSKTTITTIPKIENDNNNNWAPPTESSEAKVVLNAIDDFCITRHWMMHVGSEKGKIIESFVKEFCTFITTTKKKNITLLELGTYCGYSSILIMSKLLSDDEMKILLLGGGNDDNEKPSLSFYTVEVVESNAQIAKQLIKLAGLEDYIHVLRFDPFKESLTKYLKRKMSSDNTTTTNNNDTNAEEVDFLFIDHDKDLYLPDLQELENSGLIKEGCHVAADNVVFAKIDNYRDYVAQLQKEGIVQTRLEESRLEYCNPDLYENDDAKNDEVFRDGIELTVYLKDPPSIE